MAKAKNKVESVKLEFGSVRQKTPGGTYYFRYQLNGIRKEIPLLMVMLQQTLATDPAVVFAALNEKFSFKRSHTFQIGKR